MCAHCCFLHYSVRLISALARAHIHAPSRILVRLNVRLGLVIDGCELYVYVCVCLCVSSGCMYTEQDRDFAVSDNISKWKKKNRIIWETVRYIGRIYKYRPDTRSSSRRRQWTIINDTHIIYIYHRSKSHYYIALQRKKSTIHTL